jgi:hypothetical protein
MPFDKATATGSIRSILKDKNAPGTGRSVRFFSKDAFKIISPDPSVQGSSDMESTMQQPHTFTSSTSSITKSSSDPPRLRSPPRSVMDVFPTSSSASPLFDSSKTSLHATLQNGDLSDFFADASMEHDIPPAIAAWPGLSVNAVEMTDSETDEHHRSAEDDETARVRAFAPRAASTEPFGTPERASSPAPGKSHDRSQSFSFGQTLFQSVARTFSTSSDPAAQQTGPAPTLNNDADRRSVFRPRAKSETLLSIVRTSSAPSETGSAASDSSARSSHYLSALSPRSPSEPLAPEEDIADLSSGALIVFSHPDPDPFAADAKTYYTPDAHIPQTPEKSQASAYFPGALSFGEKYRHQATRSTPSLISSISGSLVGDGASHSRASSRDEGLVTALRAQLDAQEQLSRQYELDLAAKAELVSALQERLANTSAESDQRRSAAKAWRKKVAELERACRALEEQADRSAQDMAERSVLEEASSGALRLMHQRINALENERRDAERTAAQLRDELKRRDEQERLLKEDIRDAKEQIETMVEETQDMGRVRERERWNTERSGLVEQLARAEQVRDALENEVDALRQTVRELEEAEEKRKEEMEILKAEVEAQWKNTEEGGERITVMKKAREEAERERDELARNFTALENRVNSMEADFAEGETRRADLEEQLNQALDAKEELERDREEVVYSHFTIELYADEHFSLTRNSKPNKPASTNYPVFSKNGRTGSPS